MLTSDQPERNAWFCKIRENLHPPCSCTLYQASEYDGSFDGILWDLQCLGVRQGQGEDAPSVQYLCQVVGCRDLHKTDALTTGFEEAILWLCHSLSYYLLA